MKKLKKIKGGLSRNEMRKINGAGLPPEDPETIACPTTTCTSSEICGSTSGSGSCSCKIGPWDSVGVCQAHG
ncbi:hypothetical protein [Chryseobacterium sp.]|uniref:hypothetical protein n=1 Tax=Chryseobacterium sp. TaxID=1871047 RepID=UPI0031D52D0D